MRKLAIGVAVLLVIGGCGGPVPGLRWAPDESQKQVGQPTADLAVIVAGRGLKPGSTAARRLATGARTSATYIGHPDEPVNVEGLIPETDPWSTQEERIRAIALKVKLQATSGEITARHLADLVAYIGDKGKVAVEGILSRARAVVEIQQMVAELSAAIPVPPEPGVSAAEQAQIVKLDAAIAKLDKAAAAHAARRPTVEEVVDKTLDTADSTISKVGGILENYGLLALIPGAGGVVYAARKRKQQREAQAAQENEHASATNARFEAAAAKAEATEVMERAMELLAAAPPPKE